MKFIFDLIKQGDVEKARVLFNSMKQNMSKNSPVETLALLFTVYEEEKKNGVETVFCNKKSLTELLEEYE